MIGTEREAPGRIIGIRLNEHELEIAEKLSSSTGWSIGKLTKHLLMTEAFRFLNGEEEDTQLRLTDALRKVINLAESALKLEN